MFVINVALIQQISVSLKELRASSQYLNYKDYLYGYTELCEWTMLVYNKNLLVMVHRGLLRN